MAMEASEQVKIAQQQSNKTMVELDSLRNTVNVLQDENLQLRSQLEGRVSFVFKTLNPLN